MATFEGAASWSSIWEERATGGSAGNCSPSDDAAQTHAHAWCCSNARLALSDQRRNHHRTCVLYHAGVACNVCRVVRSRPPRRTRRSGWARIRMLGGTMTSRALLRPRPIQYASQCGSNGCQAYAPQEPSGHRARQLSLGIPPHFRCECVSLRPKSRSESCRTARHEHHGAVFHGTYAYWSDQYMFRPACSGCHETTVVGYLTYWGVECLSDMHIADELSPMSERYAWHRSIRKTVHGHPSRLPVSRACPGQGPGACWAMRLTTRRC
jgi:hypothetical protein